MRAKKLAPALLAGVLAVCMAVPAFADDINQDSNPKTGDFEVNYSVNDKFTVSIPKSIDLDEKTGATVTISASAMNIKNGNELIVTLGEKAGVSVLTLTDEVPTAITLARSDAEKITSALVLPTIHSDNSAAKNIVALFKNQDKAPTFTIELGKPEAAGGIIKAGAYTATVMFTVQDTEPLPPT